MDELEQQFGVPVLEAYGMTEAAHQMASNPLPPGNRLPGAVGPGTGVEVAIMDEEGTLLITGERGEVVIRGDNVITGYENNPEANATSFTNGWFRTGDEGMLDGDGYLTLTGRLKEMINRSGEKISPLEIDNALLDHPAVGEAVAFGVPHHDARRGGVGGGGADGGGHAAGAGGLLPHQAGRLQVPARHPRHGGDPARRDGQDPAPFPDRNVFQGGLAPSTGGGGA